MGTHAALRTIGAKKVLAPSKNPSKIADTVFCSHKNTSPTIRISGSLIVITCGIFGRVSSERFSIPSLHGFHRKEMETKVLNVFVVKLFA
jgi:hypothetical protein